MLTVRNLKEAPTGLPEEFLDVIPEKCDVCGSLFSISPTLTTLSCVNPRCRDKVVMRLLAMTQTLGILGIGESVAERYVESEDVLNPLQLLWRGEGGSLYEGMSHQSWEKIFNQITEVTNKGFYLSDLAKLLNIPKVQTSAEAIFEGYETFEEAFQDIESGGIKWVQNTLGIQADGEVSVRAVSVYENLLMFKEDLLEAEKYLKIRQRSADLPRYTVVCSSNVGGGFRYKKDFYAAVEKLLEGKAEVDFPSSLKKGTDFLVWEGADGSPAAVTSKANTAMRWNEKSPGTIQIVTAAQFIDLIEEGKLP